MDDEVAGGVGDRAVGRFATSDFTGLPFNKEWLLGMTLPGFPVMAAMMRR